MKKIFLLITIFFTCLILYSCSSAPNSSTSPDADYGSMPESPSYSAPSDKGDSDGDVEAGQMTASAWSDNENFSYWLDLIDHSDNDDVANKHYLASEYEIFQSKSKALEVKNMWKFVFTYKNVPLNNAKVTIRHNNNVLFKGTTNAQGIVYAFYNQIYDTDLYCDLEYKEFKHTFNVINNTEKTTYRNIDESNSLEIVPINILDLALVVDTTGSMGDELNYLKAELQSVLEEISKNNPNLTIRLALVFYRDEGDEYVTRTFNFTQNLSVQYQNLSTQTARGGGDTPEAVHSALTELNNLSWSEHSTKIAIHVCDASPHLEANYIQSVALSTLKLAEIGVRFVPVVCSGSDNFTELVFRQMALYTGGTYTYITDHSGIGNSHTDQATPSDVVVEYLNKMLIRLITEYITGEDISPIAYNAKDRHTVNFDSQGGSKVNVQLVEDNNTITKVEDPVRPGYIFLGWIVKGADGLEFFSFDTPITSSITLQAVWANEANMVCIVKIHWNDGRDPVPLVYKKDETVDLNHLNQFINPENLNSFIGWYTYENGVLTPFDSSTPITENIDIHAIYVKNE